MRIKHNINNINNIDYLEKNIYVVLNVSLPICLQFYLISITYFISFHTSHKSSYFISFMWYSMFSTML